MTPDRPLLTLEQVAALRPGTYRSGCYWLARTITREDR